MTNFNSEIKSAEKTLAEAKEAYKVWVSSISEAEYLSTETGSTLAQKNVRVAKDNLRMIKHIASL